MNTITDISQGQVDPFYTPCRYRELMKKLPKIHDFLRIVRDESGRDVTKSLWTFIVESFLKRNESRMLADIVIDPNVVVTVPRYCTLKAYRSAEASDKKCLRDHAILFWEEFLTMCIQRRPQIL